MFAKWASYFDMFSLRRVFFRAEGALTIRWLHHGRRFLGCAVIYIYYIYIVRYTFGGTLWDLDGDRRSAIGKK